MNKHLKNTLIFSTIGLVLIYSVQLTIDNFYNKRSPHKFNKIFNHQTDKEIMVFGSSVAHVHFDANLATTLTGMSSVNEGLHGTFLGQYSSLINEYLSYEKECKYLIICCDFDNLGNNKRITRPDLFLSHIYNPFVYKSLHGIEPTKFWRAKYIPGYKLTLADKLFYKKLIPALVKADTMCGFEPVDDTASWSVSKNDTFTARFNENVYGMLIDIINTATKKGIKVFTVLTPVYIEGQNLILNKDFIRNKYIEAGKGNKNYHFIDFTTDSMCYNKSLFYNYSHMKISGAHQFTRKLVDTVLQTAHRE